MVRMKVKLEFKKEDLWIGIHWKHQIIESLLSVRKQYDIWICLLPMIPIHITIIRNIRDYTDEYLQ
jgi:hypothetical protein